MARVMRSFTSFLANNAVTACLVVPAHKKYEILEVACMHNNGGGVAFVDLFTRGGLSLIGTDGGPSPVGIYTTRITYNALCCITGDHYDLALSNSVGGGNAVITYMDVDVP